MENELTKKKQIWLIVKNILDNHGDFVDNISIHEHNDCGDEFIKIYCSQGYCFELGKIYDEQEVFDEKKGKYVEKTVFEYEFTEPWDGFKEAGLDKAIQILGVYGTPTEDE